MASHAGYTPIRTRNAKHHVISIDDLSVLIPKVLGAVPVSRTTLMSAIRRRGYTVNDNLLDAALSRLRPHGLKSKATQPRGRVYWIEGGSQS